MLPKLAQLARDQVPRHTARSFTCTLKPSPVRLRGALEASGMPARGCASAWLRRILQMLSGSLDRAVCGRILCAGREESRVTGRKVSQRWSAACAPIALTLISILAALLLGELLLRAIFSPGDYLYASLIDDPVLGVRIEPYTSGHDALGFRNRAVPTRVGVVALGDSQTYGWGVPREESWPHQLAALLHEPVYNMALGGFGPLEELYLAEHEATRFHPRLLLVGLYFGNDIADAYHAAHYRTYWYGWRETTPAAPTQPDDPTSDAREPAKHFAAVRDWLARNSVLSGFLRVRVFHWLAILEKDRLAAQVNPDSQMVWVDPADHSVRTIFMAQRWLLRLDTGNPDIHEGLRITKRAFEALKAHADGLGGYSWSSFRRRNECTARTSRNAEIPSRQPWPVFAMRRIGLKRMWWISSSRRGSSTSTSRKRCRTRHAVTP